MFPKDNNLNCPKGGKGGQTYSKSRLTGEIVLTSFDRSNDHLALGHGHGTTLRVRHLYLTEQTRKTFLQSSVNEG